ncbi:MAG: 4-hydroxybenzoyl-CoA thioesterase [Bacteroidetes bacterium GWE2_29_8]|nr:MAG: 4-hydroxybenzoyl-CoA thioesterase [Bacteroidetes bacterium GWE2_29_8]OFY19268.1 MAG: 4-hydroxybenzoyl-CoA thioesterase [Bacteroidetes bacterium GWF2_29_10]
MFIKGNELINITESNVRFSEVDSMNVVWHGNYVKYLEDGRESFGREFELGYYDVYKHGLMIPIVKLDINYKQQTRYEERIIIETKFVDTDAAKIIFDYKIYKKSDHRIVLTARSIQVFINKDGILELTNPEFYMAWKHKMGLIKES